MSGTRSFVLITTSTVRITSTFVGLFLLNLHPFLELEGVKIQVICHPGLRVATT